MNGNNLGKKGLIVVVIFLFLGMSVNPLTVALIDFTKVTEMNGNSPPSTPIFLGPTEGFVGVEYSYSINSTDPDGDDIYYGIAWENGPGGFFGPYASGEEVIFSHTWNDAGIYLVNALAKDIYNAISGFVFLEVIIREIIYVDDDNTAGPWNGTIEHPYQHIQDGIDNASEYDTVFVYNGTYYENIVINSSINLVGEDKYSTIIDGSNADDVICCRADNILISGFTIQNSGENGIDKGIELYFCENTILENNILSDNTYGVSLYYSNYNCLSYNLIIDNYYSGLSLSHADNNLIENNYFSNNDGGLRLYNSNNNSIFNNNLTSNKASGISIGTNCCYNLIFENRIESQNLDGIKLSHSSNYNNVSGNEIIDNRMGVNFYNSHNNTIFGNYLSNRMRGIDVTDSTHNVIKKNILENSRDGILLAVASDNIITTNTIINNYRGISRISGGKDNIIFYNNFFKNSNNGYEENVEHNQNWDNGEVGNYWDDYSGNDDDGDGIGDTPYNISGSESQDRYPLMEPFAQHPEFDVSGWGGIGLKISITNVGDTVATNVEWSVSVKGGLFGLINLSENGSLNSLDVGESISLTLMPFGFGLLKISIEIDASYAEKQTFKGHFFVILFIVFPTIPPLCWSLGQIIHMDDT